ncbi:MAG: PAS domain S-box protein, partial [Crocosphaera sp.]|nr:PAS domain S-box protein [Crocosphaera sp.]
MGRLWSLKEFNKNTNKQQELEKSFLKIFNHTFQFIGLLDLEGNLLAANATALNLVGVKEEDVLGKPFWETAWWNHSPQHQSQLKAGIKAAAQGQIVRFETSHFDKNNHQIEVDFSLKPIQDETGKIIGLIPEGRDITEIKKTQKQLDENKAELQAIFDVLPDLFFRMDGNGIILEYRASSEFELYVSPDIFLGKSMIDILPHTVAQKWQKAIDKVLKSRTLVSLEYSLSMAGGEEYYEARLVPFSQEQVVAIVRNISESRRSEIALKKSKTFLQTIIDYLPVALFVKDGKPEKFGQILLVNKTCEDIFGLVASEVITKNVHDLFPLEQAKFYEQKDREAFSKRELIEIPEETINIDNKGKIIAHTIKIPLYDEHQEPEYLICITEDITQRKKAELNLKKINVLLQGISSAQSQFINNTDPTILFNDLLENFLNLTESEYGFMGEILYTDQEQAYVEETYIKLRGKSSLKTQGLTDITWDEETRKFSAQNAPQDMEFHNLKSLFGAVITTGKAVIVNNPATDSKPGALPQGYAPLNTFLGLPFYQNNHLAGIMGLANRKNGYDQDLIDYLQPFLTTCANLIRAYRNESIRREAEKQREASENKLQALLKYSTDVVSIFDRQGRLMYHSPAGEQIYGFSMEEMQQQRTFNLIHPEDRTRVGKTFSKLLKEPEKIITVEYRYQTKQGNYIWMETVASNQLDNPEIKGIVANSREITQRKQVETALRDSETKFRQLAENIHEVFWIIDISMTDRTYYKSLYVSPAYEEVWGYTPEEMYKHPMQWLEAIHPEDRVLIEKDLSQKLIQGRFNHEYRIIRPDGTLRWIRDRGFPVQNHSGEFVRITGLAEDITQQKATEEEIKRLNEALRQQNYYLEQKVAQRTQELELLLNTLPDFVFVVERYTMKLLFCNQVFAEGSGFSDRNQVQGKTIFDCFSPEVADYFAQQNEQVFN